VFVTCVCVVCLCRVSVSVSVSVSCVCVVTCVRVLYVEQLNKAYGKARMDYAAWIQEHYPTRTSARRQGPEATQRMMEAFPELKCVRGYVHNMFRPRAHAHVWCVDPTGEIVDPTAHQWPIVLASSYEAIPEGAEEPQGGCYQCGRLLYRSKGATSVHCEECVKHV